MELVRENLNAHSSREYVTVLNENEFRGFKRINSIKSTAIISKIHLKSKSVDETLVEIENEFDVSTQLYFWVLTLLIVSVGIYRVYNLDSLHGLEVSLFGVAPFVVMLIGYSSFSTYDSSTVLFYKTIIGSEIPN